MKNPTLCFLLLWLLTPSVVLHAQSVDKPVPSFTLTLSMGKRDGTMVPSQQLLLVTLTNISKEVINNSWCLAFRGMYDLTVVYNGFPVEDTDAQTKYKKFRQRGKCSGSMSSRTVAPGKFQEDLLYYDTSKPGTYEFAVTRESFPWNPEKSVTVKSNAITVVVPEPEADAPK